MAAAHVVPLGDLIDHDFTTEDCVCVPRREPVEDGDGSIGWLLVHESLDGREHLERGASVPRDVVA